MGSGDKKQVQQRSYKTLKANRIYRRHGIKLQFLGQENNRFFDINAMLDQINSIVTPLMTQDDLGNYPVLDREKKERLNTLYSNLILKCDEISTTHYAGAVKGDSASEKRLINAIKKSAMQDIAILVGMNAGLGQTLPDALDNSTSRMIDISGKKLSRIGNIKSSRIVMQLKSEKGKVVKGVFTPETKIERPAYLKTMTANMFTTSGKNSDDTERSPEEKAAVEALLNKVLNNADSRYDTTVETFTALNINNPTLNDVPNKEANHYYPELQALYALNPVVFKETVTKLGEHAGMGEFTYEDNQLGSKIFEGHNVDDRNVSMSKIASLLDLNRILANAQPMSIKNGDEITQGTFMQFADGEDLTKVDTQSPFFSCDIEKNIAPSAMKSLADLQVLDYICGNLDRHRDNIFYKFDENNNLTDIKGIDNDCSFGEFSRPSETTMLNLVNAEYMKAISAGTANKIKNMTADTLLFSLNQAKLTDREKQFALNRFNQIKGLLYFPPERTTANANSFADLNVPNGKIAVIPDELWGKIKVSDLAASPQLSDGLKRNNYFAALQETFSLEHKNEVRAQAQNRPKKEHVELEEFDLIANASLDMENNLYNTIDERDFEILNKVKTYEVSDNLPGDLKEQLIYSSRELSKAIKEIKNAYGGNDKTIKNIETALSGIKEKGRNKFESHSISEAIANLKDAFDFSAKGIKKLNKTYDALDKIVDELNSNPVYGNKYNIDTLVGNLTKCMSAIELVQDAAQKLPQQQQKKPADNRAEKKRADLMLRYANISKSSVKFLKRAAAGDLQVIKEELATLAICKGQLNLMGRGNKPTVLPEQIDDYVQQMIKSGSMDKVMNNDDVKIALTQIQKPNTSAEKLAVRLGNAVISELGKINVEKNMNNEPPQKQNQNTAPGLQ